MGKNTEEVFIEWCEKNNIIKTPTLHKCWDGAIKTSQEEIRSLNLQLKIFEDFIREVAVGCILRSISSEAIWGKEQTYKAREILKKLDNPEIKEVE